MSRTHVFLRCTYPELESARTRIWNRPETGGLKGKRPTSLVQLLGKAEGEKSLASWIIVTVVRLLGPQMLDREADRVERNDAWRREPFL
jgi:hypothetical protein